MRLFIDEDSASSRLVTLLQAAGHEVLGPLRGEPDERCWAYAQEHQAAVLTMNARDFLAFVDADGHHGLLLVYRQNDASRDLRAAAVAAAVDRVAATFPDGVEDRVVVLNQFAT